MHLDYGPSALSAINLEVEPADGYLVAYTYNRRQYGACMPNHPGNRIKIRVDVTPAE